MFGKGARQIQADPTLDITKCKCCQCDKLECKGCIQGHVITPSAGCCHSKNQGLIFEYERPAFAGNGMECCPNTQAPCCPDNPPPGCIDWDVPEDPDNPLGVICARPPGCDPDDPNSLPLCSEVPLGVKRCCNIGKQAHPNVKIYYNYVGQYFKFDYGAAGKLAKKWPNNGRPRLCSFCDPTSINKTSAGDNYGNYIGQRCLDNTPPLANIDDTDPAPGQPYEAMNFPCMIDQGSDNIAWAGCQCVGGGPEDPLRDTKTGTNTSYESKRLSRYRKRQMEKNPYYRWLLDIMCYDEGRRVASPYYTYENTPDEGPKEIANFDNGTLYDHLLCVVHCEHWYEIARCPENPQHDDENGVLGGWNTDNEGNVIGANTSLVGPRFWIYACSGVPLFDFDLKDAIKNNYLTETDYQNLIESLANRETPKQEILLKLSEGGYFDVGDWRQEALNEIGILQGLSYTQQFYGKITGITEGYGSCCIPSFWDASIGPCGDTLSSYCFETTGLTCGLCGGDFIQGEQCTTATCVSCSGFKPHLLSNPIEKYLGPVRKKLWIPEEDGGINVMVNGTRVTGPAWLNPKKARPNTISFTPSIVRSERDFTNNPDKTLVNLQLPADLIKDPWGGSYPAEPLAGQTPTDEWLQFKTWRESQWLYMHARPGGWDYVCGGFVRPPQPGEEAPELEYRIPDLPRRYSNIGNAPGGCLAGVFGYPQKSFEFDGGGCPDISCGYIDPESGELVQFPVVGCDTDVGSCLAIECDDGSWCSTHPEQGGGLANCRGIAFNANCSGIRFIYYRHKIVQSSGAYPVAYSTCNGIVNSYLYTVNKTTGNYDEFCPHTCRNLSIPIAIENAIPAVYSNRLSHFGVCKALLAQNDLGIPYPGKQCEGLFCFSNRIVDYGNEGAPINSPWYGRLFSGTDYCCGGRRNGASADKEPPTDPSHNAASCPKYPGPGYPPLYDGKFVGTQVDFNPKVCCWKCSGEGIAEECLGIKDYFECLQLVNQEQSSSGIGFLYIPDNLSNPNACCNLPQTCACSKPENFGINCPQDGESSGTAP